MNQTSIKLIAAVAAVAGVGAVTGVLTLGPRKAAAAPTLDASVTAATVTRQTIAEQDQVNGTIGYAGSYAVLNQYSPPASSVTIAQAQHAVDAARQSLSDTQASIDFTNQQDSAAVSADQAQLQSDQAKSNADGCGTQPNTAVCQADASAISHDQHQLDQDRTKQQSDQIANQTRLHSAQQNLTSAQDQYNAKVQPGGGGGSGGGGAAGGTYTALPNVGQIVDRGQTLYSVSGRPIPLFFGGTPLARQLAVGVSGDDVKELEDNLISLGYGDGLTADGNFTQADAAAVRRWQAALGVPQTGLVSPGEAVFCPGRLRVAQVKVALGASSQAGQDIIDGTSPDHVVTISLDARKQTLVKVGAAVDVALPNGTRVKGTISDVGGQRDGCAAADNDPRFRDPG